jgi:hypothetical protein|tara:strand:+ start:271 stop:888 length:618 start_codon:yes stop_codon:yes gene_type:complete
MPEIRTIGISDIRVWDGIPAMSVPKAPPVTVNIGVPIIDMPTFNPMDFRPKKSVVDPKAVLPKPDTSSPEAPKPPTPAPFQLPKTAVDEDPRCPPLRAKEVGTLVQGGSKRIAGYEIQDGKCVVLYEEITLPEQVIAAIPSLPQVTTVGVTAAVGVTAGLATPFLLKLVKPIVKKIGKKIKALLGRKAKPVSVFERRQAQRLARK